MLMQLAIIGLLAALLPLAVVWVSSDTNKYRKLSWVTLFLTFDLIMFGAFTRLTDSGLGCPDWPGCYGYANPFQAQAHINAAETAMPNGPVTLMKAWIEMTHRYVAMAVGVLIIAISAVAWRGWLKSSRQDSRFKPYIPTLLVVFVCVQGAFGAWTVTLKLQPLIVTIHLLLGLMLLAMLTWHSTRQSEPVATNPIAVRMRGPALIGLVLLAVQITLGGWVSTNYAALACMDFPLCHGSLLPEMDFANGFSLWRDLGRTANGNFLPFPALTAIHWTHRSFAFIVVFYLIWLGCKARQVEGLQKIAQGLIVVVLLQFLVGVTTVFLQWPLALAVIHNGLAALLVILMVMLNYRARIAIQGQKTELPGPLRPHEI